MFAIYMVKLVTDWLLNEIGGLEKMAGAEPPEGEDSLRRDRRLRRLLPGACRAGCRSMMNVPFRLAEAGAGRAVPEAGGRTADCAS